MKTYLMENYIDKNQTSVFNEKEITIEAKSGADACRKLLDKLGVRYTKIVRSASNNVSIKAMPFYFNEYGQKCVDGVVSWFEVWDGNSVYC